MTAPNTLGSFPSTDLDEQDRMGPLFTESPGFDFWWNRQWPNGAYTAATIDGWEGADFILPLDQVGGRDGAHTGPQSVAPRTLNITGLIVAPSDVVLYQMLAQLRRMFYPQGSTGARLPIVVERHDWVTGTRWAMITRPSGPLTPLPVPGTHKGGNAARVSFTLIAANPYKYQSGAFQSQQIGLADPSLITGRTYDKDYDYDYGAGGTSPGGEMVVVNNGDQLAWPIYYVTGEADEPIISNVTSGKSFQLDYNVPSLETVTINSGTGEISPGNIRLLGTPFPLLPGANTIRWRTASNAFHPEALLRMEWRSTAS